MAQNQENITAGADRGSCVGLAELREQEMVILRQRISYLEQELREKVNRPPMILVLSYLMPYR